MKYLQSHVRMTVFSLTIILLILTIAISGCDKLKGEKGARGAVVAEVNGTKITVEEFKKQFEQIPDFAKPLLSTPEGKRRFLEELVNKELIYKEAMKQGLDKDKDYIARVEDFKKAALLDIVLQREIEAKVSIKDEDVKKYYDTHPDEFKANGKVRASHILVGTEAEAKKIKERLRKGEDFAKLAVKFSQDRETAKRGGDIGLFGRGQMIPEFEQAAFNLKVGEVSDIIKTQYGYHLIKLTDKKAGKPLEFSIVSDALRQKLSRAKQKEAFETWLADLKKNAKITVNEDVFKSLTNEKKEPMEKKQLPEKKQEGVNNKKEK
ncbi:MAG: peptidylprolyl isomerase [Nitrospirota bacterium]